MKKIKYLPLFCFLIYTSIFSQIPDTIWTSKFGADGQNLAYSIQQTSDNGFILAGKRESPGTGDYDFLLIKTDVNGKEIWSKTFGGNAMDEAAAVRQTFDDGYIIAGITRIESGINPQVCLLKTDANGDSLWEQTFGGSSIERAWAVEQTADSGYILTGLTYSYGHGNSDVWLLKINSDGELVWTKTFGSDQLEEGYSVQQTEDLGYIICGFTDSFGAGQTDAYIVKTDENGELEWSNTYGGPFFDYGYCIRETIDGYIITGEKSNGNSEPSDVWLFKIDKSGNQIWSRTYGGAETQIGSSVTLTDDGGYMIAGYSYPYTNDLGNSEVWIIKTDAQGNSVGNKLLGEDGLDIATDIIHTKDNGYAICGYTERANSPIVKVLLIKLAPITTEINSEKSIFNDSWELMQNYPNPFNPITTIKYSIPLLETQNFASQQQNIATVQLKVYDILGKEVATLVNKKQAPGNYEIEFDASSLSSGIYFYTMRANNFIDMKKMLLLK